MPRGRKSTSVEMETVQSMVSSPPTDVVVMEEDLDGLTTGLVEPQVPVLVETKPERVTVSKPEVTVSPLEELVSKVKAHRRMYKPSRLKDPDQIRKQAGRLDAAGVVKLIATYERSMKFERALHSGVELKLVRRAMAANP